MEARDLHLHLEVTLPAPPERVFEAFSHADDLRQWWGPKSYGVSDLEFDVAEGARYRITMQPPHGEEFHIGGTFRVVKAPSRVVFTFAYEEPDPDDQVTLVTLSLVAVPRGTNVVIDQHPFRTEARRTLHRDGWTDTLDRLSHFVN